MLTIQHHRKHNTPVSRKSVFSFIISPKKVAGFWFSLDMAFLKMRSKSRTRGLKSLILSQDRLGNHVGVNAVLYILSLLSKCFYI